MEFITDQQGHKLILDANEIVRIAKIMHKQRSTIASRFRYYDYKVLQHEATTEHIEKRNYSRDDVWTIDYFDELAKQIENE